MAFQAVGLVFAGYVLGYLAMIAVFVHACAFRHRHMLFSSSSSPSHLSLPVRAAWLFALFNVGWTLVGLVCDNSRLLAGAFYTEVDELPQSNRDFLLYLLVQHIFALPLLGPFVFGLVAWRVTRSEAAARVAAANDAQNGNGGGGDGGNRTSSSSFAPAPSPPFTSKCALATRVVVFAVIPVLVFLGSEFAGVMSVTRGWDLIAECDKPHGLCAFKTPKPKAGFPLDSLGSILVVVVGLAVALALLLMICCSCGGSQPDMRVKALLNRVGSGLLFPSFLALIANGVLGPLGVNNTVFSLVSNGSEVVFMVGILYAVLVALHWEEQQAPPARGLGEDAPLLN